MGMECVGHLPIMNSVAKNVRGTSLLLYALNSVFPQVELAELCAKSERYIGTEGGGMDQSICFLAEKGTVRTI